MRRPKARGDRRSLGGGGGHLELFRSSVTISRDGNVHVTGSTRFCTRRHGEAANQRARHASIAKLREDALQRALDGVQRRGHAPGIPTPSPNSAPGRRAYQAPTRSSNACSGSSGDSRRSRWRSMRSATSISANAMRSFSVGVSRPGSDIRPTVPRLARLRALQAGHELDKTRRNRRVCRQMRTEANATGLPPTGARVNCRPSVGILPGYFFANVAVHVGATDAARSRIACGRSSAPVSCRISSTSAEAMPTGHRSAQALASSREGTSMT